jgi:rSAM/selenodomain-associated transferase 2
MIKRTTRIPAELTISVIIPVWREQALINRLLEHLLTEQGGFARQLIVVDGEATGPTLSAIGDRRRVIGITSAAGRARQMNAGAALAKGEILLFLHADTLLPPGAPEQIRRLMASDGCDAGAFSLGVDSRRWAYRLIAWAATWRSRLSRVPYGDQAIFMRRSYFIELGGFADISLMEDVELMRRIKRRGGRAVVLPSSVTTSARRWERQGIILHTLRNWLLVSLFYLGVPADKLARYYR